MTRKRWRQDRTTGELRLVDTTTPPRAPSHSIRAVMEPFVSPVDRTVIHSERQLREHNKRNDVVQHREYGANDGQAYFERANKDRLDRLQGKTREDRQNRLEAVISAVDKHR